MGDLGAGFAGPSRVRPQAVRAGRTLARLSLSPERAHAERRADPRRTGAGAGRFPELPLPRPLPGDPGPPVAQRVWRAAAGARRLALEPIIGWGWQSTRSAARHEVLQVSVSVRSTPRANGRRKLALPP